MFCNGNETLKALCIFNLNLGTSELKDSKGRF